MPSFIQRLTKRTPCQQHSLNTVDPQAAAPEVVGDAQILAASELLGALTDAGRRREHNEDAFYVSSDGRLLIVADGMGGYEAGEVASALAVAAVAEVFKRQGKGKREAAKVEPLLREAFQCAHQRILDEREKREHRLMGSTLIVAYLDGPRLTTCHVGDVRCYVHTDAGLEQITHDHSVVGELVRARQLTPIEACTHPRKNEVLQAIGMSTSLEPEVNVRKLHPGDFVLLCSDGLWGALSDEEILATLAEEGSVHERATRLVERANAAGGPDNITVVLRAYDGSTRSGRPVSAPCKRTFRLLLSLSCLVLLAGGGFYFLKPFSGGTPPASESTAPPEKNEVVSRVDVETQERIDRWIAENDLNEYGDPKGTMYMGGSPLFDESTGQSRERYEYVLEKHPELRHGESGKEGKPDDVEKR